MITFWRETISDFQCSCSYERGIFKVGVDNRMMGISRTRSFVALEPPQYGIGVRDQLKSKEIAQELITEINCELSAE